METAGYGKTNTQQNFGSWGHRDSRFSLETGAHQRWQFTRLEAGLEGRSSQGFYHQSVLFLSEPVPETHRQQWRRSTATRAASKVWAIPMKSLLRKA